MDFTYWLALTGLLASVFMTGVIWFVQIIHYPLFKRVGVESFAEYEQIHTRRTGYVVAPVMLVEMASGLGLLLVDMPSNSLILAWIGMIVLVVIWLVTFLVQVPLHRELTRGYDSQLIGKLVGTNWLRVALWSARSAVMIWMIADLQLR